LLEQLQGRPITTTPDGRYVAINHGFDLWLVPVDGKGEPHPLLRTDFVEGNPTFSPDGRWFAYISNDSGPFEVYVRPVDGSSGRLVVSRGSVDDVIWSASGDEIVYRSSGQVFSAPIDIRGGGEARIGNPVALFPDRYALTTARDMDLARDGRLLMLEEVQPAKLDFFEHWFESLSAAPR
jgi:hypothetical protein